MVDKALFIDTSGAKDSMHRLEMIANNLANVSTVGFRADYEVLKQVTSNDQDKQTRFYSSIDKSYSDFDPGPIITTGRDLDIAFDGKGFIAVQSKTGDEGYTRAGNLQIRNGFLTTRSGELVLGTGGVINVPDNATRISINSEGSVAVKMHGQVEMVTLDKIKLTNPPVENLQKGKDGLFRLSSGESVKADDTLRILPGALEGSNVNPVETLTSLIQLSREFEFHTHLMSDFKDNASKANQLLELPR